MRRSHRPSLGSDSAGWSGTFLAARDALSQVATEASLAATQLHALLGTLSGSAGPAGPSPGSGNPAAGLPPSSTPSLSSVRANNASLADSLPSELGATMHSWDRLGDRSAQVIAAGWASSVHAVSVELTNAIFVTGQWGDAFVRTGERVVQQLIEVAAQALIVRTIVGTGLGGFFGLANGIASVPSGGLGRFASGGLNLDTIPALLSPGEAVLRSAAVAELGTSFIAGLNTGVVDLDRLSSSAPVSSSTRSSPHRSGGLEEPGTVAPAQHFHFAFHDDGSAARRYLSGVEGRKFLIDASRQTVHEVTGRS